MNPKRPIEKILTDVVRTFGDGPPKTKDDTLMLAWQRPFARAMREAQRIVEAIDREPDGRIEGLDDSALAEADAPGLTEALQSTLEGASISLTDHKAAMTVMFDVSVRMFIKGLAWGRSHPEAKP